MPREIAAPPLLRRLNAATVLEQLRDDGPHRVTELVEHTGLSRPTVERIVDDLVEAGWLAESFFEPGQRRGRPARELSFRADAAAVLGIDIGVRRASVAVADLGGTLSLERSAALDPDLSRAERLERVAGLASEAVASVGFAPDAVIQAVAGSPGIVDVDAGVVSQCSLMPDWSGLPLASELTTRLGIPVRIDNDANLAAEGERWLGVAQGVRDVVFVLAGERLGAGIVVDGAVVRGFAGGAGEMGFTQLLEAGPGSEGIGALARQVGSTALRGLLDADDPRASGELLRTLVADDPEQVNTEVLLEAARLGDSVARAVIESILGRIARAIAVLGSVLNPELIVIGGAVAEASEQILGPLREEVRQLALLPTRIEASSLSHRSVALGAVHQSLTLAVSDLVERQAPVRT